MNRRALLINDLPGYGKVALSAMLPVLSHLGCETFNLPTALVSNTLDYGKFHILETTDYMEKTVQVWEELGFTFDAVATGFIVSERQAQLVAGLCRRFRERGAKIFTDPIMGDNGKLYNGVTAHTVELMRTIIATADCIVPNYTEAAYLSDTPYRPEGAELKELHSIIDKLRELGAGSVVVTSCPVLGQGKSVVGWDNGSYFQLPYEEIPVRFPGTGDIFSAVLLGKVLSGAALPQAAQAAMEVVRELIDRSAAYQDKYKGIPLETCLEVLDR
jgi:pyridoxine kinase